MANMFIAKDLIALSPAVNDKTRRRNEADERELPGSEQAENANEG